MSARRASRRASRGFSLVWALVLLVIVGGAASATVSRLTAMRQDAAVDETAVAAVLAADGAVATARARLARDPAWPGDTVPVGLFRVETSVARTAAGFTVTAEAAGAAVVEATLVAVEGGPPRVAAWRRVR